MAPPRVSHVAAVVVLTLACGKPAPAPARRVIEIDVDDHGLKALWNADAPNLKGLIKDGTLAFSRVVIPTHSNQSNLSLLTGCWPDGHGVPTNSYLERGPKLAPGVRLGPLSLGAYAAYPKNPLGRRVASTYSAAHAAGLSTRYVGQLPIFELGADDVHITIAGASFFGITVTGSEAYDLLTTLLQYPPELAATYRYEGPPRSGETLEHFSIREAAELIRAGHADALPRYTFLWAFIALDGNPTGEFGADGPELAKVVHDYDDAIGDLLAALREQGLDQSTDVLFTLDHGKVDVDHEAALSAQLAAAVAADGGAHQVAGGDYQLMNEDGDAYLWATTPNAGVDASATARQQEIAHGLVDLVQRGALVGVDTARTVTWDGYGGTRRFDDLRMTTLGQGDVIVFPQDGWTLGSVDGASAPGLIDRAKHPNPFGRHGGISADELYVPLILHGPDFKRGALLPTPVDHADVAPTALAALGVELPTAEGSAIHAAFAGDPGETLPLPADLSTSRDVVLANAGYLGSAPPSLAGAAASSVVIVDVAGLSSVDDVPGLAALAASGASYESYYTRRRDWPVTEWEMLVGSYPVALPFIPFAEDDPTQVAPPGLGQLAMLTAAAPIADSAGYDAWRAPTVFPGQSVFSAAKALGRRAVFVGVPDQHLAHLASSEQPELLSNGGFGASLAAALSSSALVYVSVDRTSARDVLAALQMLRTQLGDVLVVVTSRGASPLDEGRLNAAPRHVPLVLNGPNIRAGVVVSERAWPADLAPTVLYALGAKARAPDVEDAVRLDGGADASGRPLPLPHDARAGHVLLRAFTAK